MENKQYLNIKGISKISKEIEESNRIFDMAEELLEDKRFSKQHEYIDEILHLYHQANCVFHSADKKYIRKLYKMSQENSINWDEK